ncbi:G protein-activated inward rectifier potassium channel 3 isoform X1 [Anopheles darlingi]|uniref:G protein-activated inward rectifier potassium channel 3 isoform X1 n=2 Tax=Anopheles darlingi TaxID=43151 RepID=UPI002100590A|nr:G protein-activated inward rectifier potassium channel 3 isoform X1 [Anopheles darlingi]XP_049530479.1 G protein-activated inward rectifier potassium channel 3 isoform X1 [Anopheles darlingi]XP_049530480.1 G protein-activated inward rectifier potassium channel 3 isoform X1 [Anopheles darlingi]XP_049530481.1 G protein-activated inward rectifier potassium channel 3 isoform X1 [Anopheles darlingi]XP_049530482.1 G protein-activated inward rectifier potassium channel 3 isoform X1 [Anopheles darli
MTKLLEDVRSSDRTPQDGDGAACWTKLLDDSNSTHKPIIIGPAVVTSDANTGKDLLVTVDPETGKTQQTVDSTGRDPVTGRRRESILGTFHRQLRMSLKAVSDTTGPLTRYRQTRYSSRRIRKRVIFKQGDCNVIQGNMAKRRRRYLQDIFTTLVDIQWRWTLFVFACSFILSWLGFGAIWFLIALSHGDVQAAGVDDSHKPCVTYIYGFTSAFLFSLETQHTIGYGNRYITEECPEAIFILALQSITGVFIQAFMVGIVFAKLSRPKKRAQTLLFSKNAVICHRDGMPCLLFRVGDMRKSHIIEAHVTAQIIRRKVTKEGEILPFYQQNMEVSCDGGDDRLMFIWPTIVVHKIDRDSPLYNLSAQDMLRERFEIVVMLEGVVESTGMTTQARSSYLPSEILWGHRFESVVSFKRETGEYEVDYTTFNDTYEVDTPLCSARQLHDVKKELNKQNGVVASSESDDSDSSSVDNASSRKDSLSNGYLRFAPVYGSVSEQAATANLANGSGGAVAGTGDGATVLDHPTLVLTASPATERKKNTRKLSIKEPSMDSLC